MTMTQTEMLEDFAFQEFDACIEKLLEPVTSNPLVELATLLKIFDLPSFDLDMEQMLLDGIYLGLLLLM